MAKTFFGLVTFVGLATAAFGQSPSSETPLLGEADASGHVYLLPPDETRDWPDVVALSGPKISSGSTGRLDRVLRDVHPPTLEDSLASSGTTYDPETDPIGAIQTLADATIIAELRTDGATLRLSEWERTTPAQHIYHHYVVDVIRGGNVDQVFMFSRAQGVLG